MRSRGRAPLSPQTAEEAGRYLLCMVQGMRVLGKVDMSEAELTSIVDMALRALV